MSEISVSIIIPCRDKNTSIDGLLKNISNQKVFFNSQLIKITNVSPSGYARNIGAKQADGEILIFIDCDVRLGNESVLSNLIKPLIEDKNIGMVCASVRLPLAASKFQVRYAKEIPHCETPIVDKITEVWVATAQCCAIFKDIFLKIGMFNEKLIRGVDPEFSFRIKKGGYRTVLAAHTWFYHPYPDNVVELVKINFRNGLATAFVDTFYPELNIDVDPRGVIYSSERKSKFIRIIRFLLSLFTAILGGKLLLLLSKFIYSFSYLFGFSKYRLIFYAHKLNIKHCNIDT